MKIYINAEVIMPPLTSHLPHVAKISNLHEFFRKGNENEEKKRKRESSPGRHITRKCTPTKSLSKYLKECFDEVIWR